MIRAFLSFRTILLALAAYGLTLLLIIAVAEEPSTVSAKVAWARNVALGLMIFIIMFFGWSGYHSPWRFLWRRFPKLNEWVFPDLNGIWLGETKSNWPIIENLRNAAAASESTNLESIEKSALKATAIAFRIQADWFRIRIWARTDGVNGSAESLLVKASKNVRNREFEISYLYEQKTPIPKPTDSDVHPGAAMLGILPGETSKLIGEYWTRRNWARGMNTAGILSLHQISDRTANKSDDILKLARSMDSTNPDQT